MSLSTSSVLLVALLTYPRYHCYTNWSPVNRQPAISRVGWPNGRRSFPITEFLLMTACHLVAFSTVDEYSTCTCRIYLISLVQNAICSMQLIRLKYLLLRWRLNMLILELIKMIVRLLYDWHFMVIFTLLHRQWHFCLVNWSLIVINQHVTNSANPIYLYDIRLKKKIRT